MNISNTKIYFVHHYLFVANDPMNYWDYLGMQRNIIPDPSSLPPYSTTAETFKNLGMLQERHNPHCKNEGRMNLKKYEEHYDKVMNMLFHMHTQSTRKVVGNNIFFAFANNPTQLYGMNINGFVSIKKVSGKKMYIWKMDVNITNVKTCGCCAENKTCGPLKDVTPSKTHHVFEFTEVLQ